MKGQLSKTRNCSVFWTLIFCLSLSYIAISVQALDHQGNEFSAPRKLAGTTTLAQCLAVGGATTAFPGTTAYTNARSVYNLANQYAPAAFVFPTTVVQVQNALQCSKQFGIGIVPRGGGHSYEDYSLGGRNGVLVVDMTGFTSISYNKAAQTATIGSGWRLGPLYLALWNLGKVTLPAGNCPTVGVAGHSLGGGWGFSSRQFGMVTDNILEAQVVIANGTLVTANAQQNSDLYFALRGAGATSFGIVTQFTFQVHDVSGPITRFDYSWTNQAQQFQAFKAFQIWGVNAVSEISASFYMDPSGNSNIEGVYLGPQTSLAPLIETFVANIPTPASSDTVQTDWITLIVHNAGFPAGSNPTTVLSNPTPPTASFKAKSIYVDPPGLSDAGINAMINAMRQDSNDNAYFIFDLYGATSNINKVATSATAFVHRTSLFSIQMVAYWTQNAAQENPDLTFISNYWNAVRPFATAEAYQNYIDNAEPLSAYFGSNLNTLTGIKLKWDPKNVFNFPQSIPV
ncbi:unnamed protein product [Sphagnum troendelagicum]|uniref:FAD-binding PCMH-type domain-containing protein n=1 Tax=Sphagnum troendelagicum TaxID=128251 RepID=A0ABP0TS45_9BRYO